MILYCYNMLIKLGICEGFTWLQNKQQKLSLQIELMVLFNYNHFLDKPLLRSIPHKCRSYLDH